MSKLIAIVEGNHEGLTRWENGMQIGAAEGFAACLSSLETDLSYRMIRPHFTDHKLHDALFEGCDAIVFTGSGNSWSADDKQAAPARDVMSVAFKSGLPIFGSCYGLQLAVAVLGGQNRANPEATEFSIARDITLNEAGQGHPLYHAKPRQFDARCMHRDEVAYLPQGAQSLSANTHSAHQSMVYETDEIRFWGVQYHPELEFADIANYIETNDVRSFSDANAFAKSLGLSAQADDIIDDFRRPDFCDDDDMIKKYQLTKALREPQIHRCELVNFLKMVSDPFSG